MSLLIFWLQPQTLKFTPAWPYTKPIVIFTMASSSESRRARVGLINGTLLAYVKRTRVRHSIGPLLCRKQVLAARVWARTGRQVNTGGIIPATARYWQPIFGKFFSMLGQCWAVSNFALEQPKNVA